VPPFETVAQRGLEDSFEQERITVRSVQSCKEDMLTRNKISLAARVITWRTTIQDQSNNYVGRQELVTKAPFCAVFCTTFITPLLLVVCSAKYGYFL